MRTNIEIDEKLLRQAMKASQTVTKKAAVDAALRLTVQLKKQEKITGLFGKVQWDGNLDAMRESRVLDWEEKRMAQSVRVRAKRAAKAGPVKVASSNGASLSGASLSRSVAGSAGLREQKRANAYAW